MKNLADLADLTDLVDMCPTLYIPLVNSALGIAFSLRIAHFKKRPWAIDSRCKRATMSNLLFLQAIHNFFLFFLMFLTVFPLFYASDQIAHIALCSFALFSKRDLSDLLFTKEWLWVIGSCRSLKRANVWFTQKANEQIPNPKLIKELRL